jgi:hypothetical protein
MTAAELVKMAWYMTPSAFEPILARALAEERNRAIDDVKKALTCPHEYPDPECRPYKCIGKMSNDVFHVLEGLKTDPAESGMGEG